MSLIVDLTRTVIDWVTNDFPLKGIVFELAFKSK